MDSTASTSNLPFSTLAPHTNYPSFTNRFCSPPHMEIEAEIRSIRSSSLEMNDAIGSNRNRRPPSSTPPSESSPVPLEIIRLGDKSIKKSRAKSPISNSTSTLKGLSRQSVLAAKKIIKKEALRLALSNGSLSPSSYSELEMNQICEQAIQDQTERIVEIASQMASNLVSDEGGMVEKKEKKVAVRKRAVRKAKVVVSKDGMNALKMMGLCA